MPFQETDLDVLWQLCVTAATEVRRAPYRPQSAFPPGRASCQVNEVAIRLSLAPTNHRIHLSKKRRSLDLEPHQLYDTQMLYMQGHRVKLSE